MARDHVVSLKRSQSPLLSSPSLNPREPDAASRIFTILPVAIQARIPRLPSFRHSMSGYSLPTKLLTSAPQSHMPTVNKDSCRAHDVLNYKRPSSPDSSSPASREGEEDSDTGTGWKHANQGLSLLETAVTESLSPSDRDQAFARQLYIHATAYLLQGLPSELSDQEATTLRTALPGKVRQERQASIQSSSSKSASRTEPSLLHRLLASGIIQLFLFIQFILPHVKYFLYSAYRYEREHRVSEKVLSSSIDTVEQVSKQSFNIGGALLKAGNGRLGGVVLESAAWWIEGISGGIHEGIGKGVEILGRGRGWGEGGMRGQ